MREYQNDNKGSFLDYDESKIRSKAQNAFMNKVYAWMLSGLLITGFTAFGVAESGFAYYVLTTPLKWVCIIAQLGAVFALAGAIHKMKASTASIIFLAYSALTGVTFSSIFLAFSGELIANVFFITAGMFGALSAYGFLTKKNLSAWAGFLFMGLIGVVIASFVNMFVGGSAMNFVISLCGIIVFSGLTAYDTQKIKEIYEEGYSQNGSSTKGAIMGALTLYLDFINLFLMILRLFGRRD